MRALSHFVSVIFHPLCIVTYVTLFLVYTNPYIFGFSNPKAQGLLLISVVTITFMFPAIAIGLMKTLGLISSLQMPHLKERIAPLVTTGLFYLWLYINIKQNDVIPTALTFFILGSTIAIFVALVINIFTKVSLHAIALGGFVMGMALILFYFSHSDIVFSLSQYNVILDQRTVLFFVILAAGLVGTARLYLGAHKPEDVYGGYIVGILSQLVAFNILI